MYDLMVGSSAEFYLIRKQNGNYTRLDDGNKLDMIMKADFRDFLYRLSMLPVEESQ